MAERGHGSIVLVGSSAARRPAPIGAAYAASKAGTELLTRYWATEFGAVLFADGGELSTLPG